MPCYDAGIEDPPWLIRERQNEISKNTIESLSREILYWRQYIAATANERNEMGNLLCELGKAYEKGELIFIHPYIEPSLFKVNDKRVAQKFQDWWEKHKERDANK